MYLVVAFEEDDQTGLVAKEWFSDGLAWWPPHEDKAQLIRSVKKKVVPQPRKGWKLLPARVLYESDSLEKIQARWESMTSNVSTDMTEIQRRKRPKQSPSSSTSSSSFQSEEEDAPTLLSETQPQSPKTPKRVCRGPPKSTTPPPSIEVVIQLPEAQEAIAAMDPQPQLAMSNGGHSPAPACQAVNTDSTQIITLNVKQELEPCPIPDCHQEATASEASGRSDEEMEAKQTNDDALGSATGSEYPRSHPPQAYPLIPTNCTAAERMILEKLWELHVKMDHLTAVVQTLCEKQGQDHLPLRNDYDKRLPILTLEGLNSFDESLRQDGDFKKYLIAKLSIVGGSTVKNMVWRVCKRVFAPELAIQLNWCGRGKKTGIKSRPIHEMLLSSLLQQHKTTESEIEAAIKNWLRLSQDRIGRSSRPRRQALVEPQPH